MIEKCAVCKIKPAKHLHHIDYEADEKIPVCLDCHNNIHKNKNHKYFPKTKRKSNRMLIELDKKTYAELLSIKNSFELIECRRLPLKNVIEKLIFYHETGGKKMIVAEKNNQKMIQVKKETYVRLLKRKQILEKKENRSKSFNDVICEILNAEGLV